MNMSQRFSLPVPKILMYQRSLKQKGAEMELFAGLDGQSFALAIGVALLAGVVKGAVGFAMPMILMSGLASILPVEIALAAMILPTVATNLSQALRQGPRAALQSIKEHRWLIGPLLICIAVSAQFVTLIPQSVLFAILGGPIILFALSQLWGWGLQINPTHQRRAEVVTGVVAGFFGGISGVWGPPILMYLLGIGAEKRQAVRVQGVVFVIGAFMLTAAHLQSGILNMRTLPLSAAMVVPAGLGLWLGYQIQDRLDAARFRRWTLIFLILTGANLLRRAFLV